MFLQKLWPGLMPVEYLLREEIKIITESINGLVL
jgi:hypothetical protein